MKWMQVALLSAGLAVWTLAGEAGAEETSTSTPPSAGAPGVGPEDGPYVPEGFEPVKGRAVDAIDPNPLVVGAYAAVLAGIFGYLVFMVRSQAELGRQVDELRRRLEDLRR